MDCFSFSYIIHHTQSLYPTVTTATNGGGLIYSAMSATNTSVAGNGNLFQEVMLNAKAAEEKYMGPDYPYYKYVRPPNEIGMSDKGSLSQLGKNINGLIDYVELMVSGGGKASATGKPLGNKFFLRTGGKCTDVDTGEQADRYIYINNVPQGNIPIVSSGLGVNFSEFKGLIPGTISNLNAFNPMEMMQSFLAGSKPDCKPITLETIDVNNVRSKETHHVTLVDLANTDPCSFSDRRNPVTNARCRETFVGMGEGGGNGEGDENAMVAVPRDPWAHLFIAGVGVLGLFIASRAVAKL